MPIYVEVNLYCDQAGCKKEGIGHMPAMAMHVQHLKTPPGTPHWTALSDGRIYCMEHSPVVPNPNMQRKPQG